MSTPSVAQLSASWKQSGEITYWFSRSAWSLFVVAQWKQQISKKSLVTVWVPEYFCNESLSLLRDMDVQLVFYPMDQFAQPSIEDFPIITDKNRPDIFLLVHYFGEPVLNASYFVDFCSEYGSWLIEDAAHVLQPIPGVGDFGDIVLFSPHKLLPIPDGAILLVRQSGPSNLDRQSRSLWLLDDIVKGLLPRQRQIDLTTLTWILKRSLQTTGIRMRRRVPEFTFRPIQNAIKVPVGMTKFSKCLLIYETSKLNEYAQHRKSILVEWGRIFQRIFDPMDHKLKTTSHIPYLACLQMDDQASAESVYKMLQTLDLPVSTWPDLPSIVLKNSQTYGNKLRNTRIYLPVHQSVTKSQLSHAAKRLLHLSLSGWKLKLITSREEWRELWLDCYPKSLPQTWEYGTAKAIAEGWQVKRLLVTNQKNSPIALFQVLEKRFPFLGGVARINQGPLMICKKTDNGNFLALKSISVLTQAMKEKKWWMLQIAPLLPPNNEVKTTLESLGYRRQKNSPMDSALLSLENDEEALLMSFNGKWRNTLRKGQKLGVTVKLDKGAYEYFDLLLSFYNKQQLEKNYNGTSEKMLRAMQASQSEDFSFNLFLAFDSEEKSESSLVGVLVSLEFGEYSQYLIGATNEKGKRLQANSVLLWEAICDSKRKRCKWFDVGGLAENTPIGIAKFKKGLNPKPYTVVGEWRKWF
jgi:lipid II:glycine glycyltransferase (peptidoglycan interpeptide bridge formation enzyme)